MYARLHGFFIGLLPKMSAKSIRLVDGKKLGYLESIRGLAACVVVFAHILAVYLPGVAISNQENLADNSIASALLFGLPFGFMISGHFAVVLFFVLSGYVLTYRFFQTNNEQDLYRQAAKRYIRLAIPIFATVMVAYLLFANGMMGQSHAVSQLTNSPEIARNYNFTPSLADAFQDATVGVIADNNIKYNPVLWTMPIEFFGSFVVFGLAAFINKTRRRWIMYLGAIILLSGSYYVCFILGMLLADIVQNTNVISYVRSKVSRAYFILSAIVIWIIASFPGPSNGIDGTIYQSLLLNNIDKEYTYRLWQFFGAFLLLALILISIRMQNILNNRILVYLGGISFAMYLVHYLILYSAGHFTYILSRGVFGATLSAAIAGIVTIALTVGVSILWKKYVDDLSVQVSRTFATYILK